MKKTESKGFFCVVYFSDTKKTCFYHKVWKPKNLASQLQNWLWIKCFIKKEDYFSDTKANRYYRIFDKNNPVENFTYQIFSGKQAL